MSRTKVQFVVGLALGFLSVAVFKHRDPAGGEIPAEAKLIAAAAATMIAPRMWWTGIIALWIGQSAASFSHLAKGAGEFEIPLRSIVAPCFDSAGHFLLGAVLGAALWILVDRRRKRTPAPSDAAVDRYSL